MNAKKFNQRVTIILSSSLLALLLISAFAPLFATALPGGRILDEGHNSGYIDWSGSVNYADLFHRDGIYPSGGTENVTQISSGGTVSGSFARDVSYFEVMLAYSSSGGFGTATIQACSSSFAVYLGIGGGSTPGFNSFPISVPSGCRSWSVSASGGNVYFRSVDANYVAAAQPPVISGSLSCSQPGGNGWCRNNAKLVLTASDPQGYALTITGNAGSVPISCNGSCTINLPSGSGTATYTVTATTSGLTASGSTTWKYDPNPPVSDVNVSGTNGSNGWYISAVNASASGSDALSGLASTVITVEGGAAVASAILTDGVHSVTATAVDVAGNTSSKTMTISVDTLAPVSDVNVNGTTGSNGWYISNVNASASGSDTNSGLASATLSVDGGAAAGSAILTDGVHSVIATAIDVAGNTSSKTLPISVDTIAPIILTSAAGNQTPNEWFSTPVDLSATASDVTSGVSESVYLSFDNGTTWVTGPLTLSDGMYDVIFSVLDLAGNTATSQMSLKIDTLAPSIVLSEAGSLGRDGWYVSAATVSAEVNDNLSGVASTQYRVNGGVWQAGAFVTVNEGIHTIDFQAFDAAGNMQSAAQEIHVDTTPPAYSFDPALNGSVLSGTVNMGGTASDETSAVHDVEFSLDGTTWIAATFAGTRWSIAWDSSVFDNGERELYLRVDDIAGNQGQPISVRIILDNFPPYVNLAETWNIWESGSLVVRNNVIPLKSVRIVVQDPMLRYPDQVIYDNLPAPKAVTWDRVIGPGSAPPGSYIANVEACDVYGLCSKDTGTILIPVTPPLIAFQLPVIEIPQWIPAIPFLSVPVPLPEQPIAVPSTTVPIHVDVPIVPFPFWTIVVIGAFLLMFAFLLMSDPRPAALRSLTRSLHPYIQYPKE